MYRWVRMGVSYPSFLFIIISCGQNNQHTSKGPIIVFDKDTVHLPNMTQGDSARSLFYFTNQGEDTLLIKNVGLSCGCTKAGFDSAGIRPQQRSFISIDYKNDGHEQGQILKPIVVETNGEAILKTVYIKGYVKSKN